MKPINLEKYSGSDSDILLDESDNCLVPCEEIVVGQTMDGIPSIDNPKYYSVSKADRVLENGDPIIGVEINGDIYGFPHNILDHHEIINHQIQDAILSITYCPLTGTGLIYHTNSELGTSGKLFENNLIFYDRDTESYWSQMFGLAIKGDRIGERHDFGESIETTWQAFERMYPNAKILSRDTGYNRDYDRYPYAQYNYLESDFLLFDSSYDEDRKPFNLYHPKELTTILHINWSYALFPFADLNVGNPLQINHNNQDIVMFFDKSHRLSIPYIPYINSTYLNFTKISINSISPEQGFGLSVYQDQLGNIWNIKGQAVNGPNLGAQLSRINSYNAFWFGATSFFTNASIYTTDEVITVTGEDRTGSFTGEINSRVSFPWFSVIGILAIPVFICSRRE